MEKTEVLSKILPEKYYESKSQGHGRAPINIALCKYWGKRDEKLNLPYASSLSISLPYYTNTTITSAHKNQSDTIILNGEILSQSSEFFNRTKEFLDLFRISDSQTFTVQTQNSIPTQAGLASSASGFAALTLALNDLYHWDLPSKFLSIIARLGSGSAARSIYEGFVEWHAGVSEDGMDSYAEYIGDKWEGLCLLPLVFDKTSKKTSSRNAMKRSVETSPFYKAFIEKCKHDIIQLKNAISLRDIDFLGSVAEQNCIAMHSTIMTAAPPVMYWSSYTLDCMKKVWEARDKGLSVYFTIDAGSNPVLIFKKTDSDLIQSMFDLSQHMI